MILLSVLPVLAMQGLITPDIGSLDPSLSHTFNNSTRHVLRIERIGTIVVLALGHTHPAEGNGLYHVGLLLENHHTIAQIRLILVATGQVPYLPLGTAG